jgi:hypothetical protein
MSALRVRMIEDMTLSGLAAGTQATYLDAVRRLAAHYRCSPDQLSVPAIDGRNHLLTIIGSDQAPRKRC